MVIIAKPMPNHSPEIVFGSAVNHTPKTKKELAHIQLCSGLWIWYTDDTIHLYTIAHHTQTCAHMSDTFAHMHGT